MKKVLIISSSPRKGGNSDTLCDEFMHGAEDAGHEVEKVFLKDKKINYCTGCGACAKTHKCAQKDDMAELLVKLGEADVIVLASPIYFYTVCGQMKVFIDRCCSGYNRIAGKDFYYILTAADPMPDAIDRAVSDFQGFLDCLDNPQEKGTLCGVGLWGRGDVKSSEYMEEAYKMGRSV